MTSKTNTEKVGLTKITVADIGLDKPTLRKLAEQGKGKPIACARLSGNAIDMKSGSTDKGDYVKFTGLFQGINYLTPNIDFRGGKMILPNVASGMLEGLVGGAKANLKTDEKGDTAGGASVVFSYEITVKADETAATGYVFGVKSLLQGEDPMATMLAELPPIPALKLLK